jgi:TolB protein
VFVRAPPGADPEGADLYVMNPDGSGRKLLVRNTGGEFILDPAWSPDGKRVAFDRSPGPRPPVDIVVVNADGTGVTNLTKNGADGSVQDVQPAWSPDGARIAYVSRRAAIGNSEIFVMRADGSGKANLTRNAADDSDPAWSPDGMKIAFVRDVGAGRGDIFVMNADGSGQTDVATNASSPSWSPDGRRIAFVRFFGGFDSDVFSMNADGSGQTNLTRSPGADITPAWSPDGRKIVLATGSATVTDDVFVMNADGSGRKRLTNDRGVKNDFQPDWGVRTAAGSTPPAGTATGTVLVNGVAFTSGPVPYGSTVDVTSGRLTLRADVGTLLVYGDGRDPARFVLTRTFERVRGRRRALVQLRLVGGDFSVCVTRTTAAADARKPISKVIRALWGKGKGHFRLRGRYATATVRGTWWLTADRCDGTLTVVRQGTVSVRDLTRRVTVAVRAGKSYLAPARRP